MIRLTIISILYNKKPEIVIFIKFTIMIDCQLAHYLTLVRGISEGTIHGALPTVPFKPAFSCATYCVAEK